MPVLRACAFIQTLFWNFITFWLFHSLCSSPIEQVIWNKLLVVNFHSISTDFISGRKGGSARRQNKPKRQTSGNRGTQSRGSKFHALLCQKTQSGMYNKIARLPKLNQRYLGISIPCSRENQGEGIPSIEMVACASKRKIYCWKDLIEPGARQIFLFLWSKTYFRYVIVH
jgi:hypothetical protein